MSPLVGISVCAREINGTPSHATPARYAEAVLAAAGCTPVLLPPMGEAMLAVLDRLDGIVLSGSPSNVEPARYGAGEDLTPGKHDPARDATTLPLIRAALDRGLPLLAICRGIQELNVALGGTLIQQVQQMPGRDDHRSRGGTLDERYAPRHEIALSGQLAWLLGRSTTRVNSLHEQAIDRPAPGLVVEALAPDGTIEGVRVAAASGWAFGVQWHPEYKAVENPDSVALFHAFGEACRAWAGLRRAA
jgi:putative glutamine amidotransferase